MIYPAYKCFAGRHADESGPDESRGCSLRVQVRRVSAVPAEPAFGDLLRLGRLSLSRGGFRLLWLGLHLASQNGLGPPEIN